MFGGLMLSCPIYSMAQESEENSATPSYIFRRSRPVENIDTYLTTLYSTDGVAVHTLRGDVLHSGKDSIRYFRVNPAGVNFGIITRNKKGEAAANLYHTGKNEKHLNKFDSRRYGVPTAIDYTPDARYIVVATDKGIYFIEPKKYEIVSQIAAVPVAVGEMALSPNGYFLAVRGGDEVVVYNIEEKRIRKSLNMGETVTGISFSPDSNDLAVLTEDGLLSLYNTRTFELRKMIDNLGDARAFAYNFDGKYAAVVTGDNEVVLVNLLRDSDREYFRNELGGVSDVDFIMDANDNTILAVPTRVAVEAIRLPHLKPFYNKLISDEVERKMDEWLKMMPGETMEEYRARVTDESRARQRRLFEDEVATRFAGDMLAGATMSLGSYDRANGVLALNFDSMPTIYLPVSEADVITIHSADDLKLSEVMYGILPDDSFEIVYARVTNTADGKSYVYDNLMRADLQYMAADDAISLELLQQQQMEEMKLDELRRKVVDEAKKMNVISDHTQITVDSKVVPEYDANGEKILNYQVSVTYTVDPEFSAQEDFGPGKYHIEESGAASAMLNIVKEAFEGEFSQYIAPGKKLKARLLGTADATPIVRGIAYDGSYGDYEEEPVRIDNRLSTITVTSKDGIRENDQLAFVRALGVKDYLNRNVAGFKDMDTDYVYEVNVSKDKGSEYRRITLELTFVDAY